MLQRRAVIEYALARRATLRDLQGGRVSTSEVCDAHPYLIRAARHHGELSADRCPVCRGNEPLRHVTYVYGDELGEASGRARSTRELTGLAEVYAELRVYVVEVCRSCSWNHLRTSFLIGAAALPVAPGRRRAGRT